MASRDDIAIEITPEVLLKAYACGIFPMAEAADDPALYWIEPQARGILPLDALHVPRRLARTVRQGVYTVRYDTAFDDVIKGCGAERVGRQTTWINEKIRKLYRALHDRGHCHSVEAWEGDKLVGGLYGVALGGAFFGESMFSYARDASKVALVHLCGRLIAGGFTLLDCQFITDHLSQFGTIEIERPEFHEHLEAALRVTANWHAMPNDAAGFEILEIIRKHQKPPAAPAEKIEFR
jgi:leucyl/phenylalanyl-tRNA---protein transferase